MTQKDISIRLAQTEDVAFLTQCAQAAYEQYVEAIGQKPAPMVFDFAARLDKETIEVIAHKSKPVGYFTWRLEQECLYLDSIAILPSMQGHGLARFAMDYVEQQARLNGKQAVELYTNIKMTGNLTLYPHLGFTQTDRRTENGFERVYFRKKII